MATANESIKEAHEMNSHQGGAMKYFIIWAALMVLTVVTVVTGRLHMPDWGLVIALVIASVKGALVALYFMHLADHQGANRVVFVTSIVFVAVLMLFTLFDIGTRFRPSLAGDGTPVAFPVETGQSLPYPGHGTNEAPERRSLH